MASKFVPLEDAAKLLGIPTEKLVEMRSSGEIRGFRDGASWKFPQDEIDRLIAEGDVGDQWSQLELGSDMASDASEIASGFSSRESDVQLVPNAGQDQIDLDDQDDNMLNLSLDSSLGVASDQDASPPISSKSDKLSSPILELTEDSREPADLSASVDEEDVDLSIDLSLSGDTPSEGIDIDLSAAADDGVSDDNEINLSAAPEPSTGGSDLDISKDEPSDFESDLNLSDSGVNPPKVAVGTDSDPMSDLNLDDDADASGVSSADVLSELNLMDAGQGEDLIHGDSELSFKGSSGISGLDVDDPSDVLDDDELVISDDDDDLVLGSAGSDVSVVGDSGINLMSPSDSGLSLESEPLDLAGSSISALDLGGEASDGTPGSAGSGSGRSGSSGSLVDFKADEEFQLSPSGIGLETDDDSGSQVIEVEDSESFSGAMDLGEGDMLDPDMGDGRGWAQRNELLADDAQGIDEAGLVAEGVEEVMVDQTPRSQPTTVGAVGYEVPYSVWQVVSLAGILIMLGIGGMLMTDLVRNLWTFNETTAPVSSLTETILNAFGFNG